MNCNMQGRIYDNGPEPFVADIDRVTKESNNFRAALWTGEYFQVTVMNIRVGGDIGVEIHPDTDQLLRIESGCGTVYMGKDKNNFTFRRNVDRDSMIIIPAGTWHNLVNTGSVPLKLYSVYAPPKHPFGTVHPTKEAAELAHG